MRWALSFSISIFMSNRKFSFPTLFQLLCAFSVSLAVAVYTVLPKHFLIGNAPGAVYLAADIFHKI